MHITETYMGGIGAAKRLVAAHLADGLPEYLAWIRESEGLQPEQLPDPDRVLAHEPQALDRWPTIAIHGLRTASLSRKEFDDPAVLRYHTSYSLRAFIWIRHKEWGPTIEQRDLFTVAVRQFMLDRPGMDDDRAVIQEEGLAEDYSDVTPVKGDRFVAGSYIDFALLVEEDLLLTRQGVRSPGGIVEVTNVLDEPINPAFL